MNFLKYITQPGNLIALLAIIACVIIGFTVNDAEIFGYVALVALAIFIIGSLVRSLKQ